MPETNLRPDEWCWPLSVAFEPSKGLDTQIRVSTSSREMMYLASSCFVDIHSVDINYILYIIGIGGQGRLTSSVNLQPDTKDADPCQHPISFLRPGKLKGSSWFLQLSRCHRLTTSVERPYRLDQYDFSSMENRLVYLVYLITLSNQVIPVRWLNRCASLLRVAGLPTPVFVFFAVKKGQPCAMPDQSPALFGHRNGELSFLF